MAGLLRSWLRVIVLFVAGLAAAGQFAKLSVAFSIVESTYPEAGKALGFSISLVSLLGAISGLFAGMLIARFGSKRALVAALAIGAAVSIYQASFPPFALFLVSRLIEGGSHLAIVIAAPTLITQLTGDLQRPAAMSLWSMFFAAGFALFAAFAPTLTHLFGQSALLWASAALSTVSALLVTLMIPRDHPEPSGAIGWAQIARLHLEVYRSPSIGAAPWGWLCYTLTYVSVLTLLPRLASDHAWLATALPLVGIVLSVTLCVLLLRLFGAIPVTVLGFGGAATSLAFIGGFPSAPWPWILLFGALALVQAGSFAAIPEINPSLRDRVLSLGGMSQTGNLGNLLGTPLLLALLSFGGSVGSTGGSAGGGTGLVLAALAGCYLFGLFLHLAFARRRQANS